jgi:hypothetical protein
LLYKRFDKKDLNFDTEKEQFTDLQVESTEIHSLPKIRKVPRLILQKISIPEITAPKINDVDFNMPNPQELLTTNLQHNEPIDNIDNIISDVPQDFSRINSESIIEQSTSNNCYENQYHNDDNIIEPRIKKLKKSEIQQESDSAFVYFLIFLFN